jgi:hypothetical protein
MSLRDRLSRSQVVIMRSLHLRSGGRPVGLDGDWQREFAPELARRGLIEIWYRQMMGDDFALRGPFLTLTLAGDRIASALFNRAPRRLSGAEQSS